MAGGMATQPTEPVMSWQEKHNRDNDAIRQNLEKLGRRSQNLVLAVIVGISVMTVATVIGITVLIISLKP